jgi:kinesin family protein 2/24
MGRLAVHEPKTSVDCSKRVESSVFEFDDSFGEDATNDDVYVRAVAPLVRLCISGAEEGANATCFAYGQTGSGKTHTMSACYEQTARDLAAGCETNGLSMRVSFYDIYGGKCYDLLSDRAPCQALEDARGRTKIVGLREVTALDATEVLSLVERGMRCRKTSRTDGNATSSRSHAVFQVTLKSKLPGEEGVKRMPSRLALVDLAGSERGADRGKLVDQRIRREGAEINKSLLALKECIRALSVGCGVNGGKDGGALAAEPSFVGEQRVPFRGSKLTQVLRDAFIGKNSKTVLLAHVSPGHGHAEHTLNTLRYAIRLKDGSDGSTPPVGPKPASPRARPHSPGSPLFSGADPTSSPSSGDSGDETDADGTRTGGEHRSSSSPSLPPSIDPARLREAMDAQQLCATTVARAGEALMARHLELADVAEEERALLSDATSRATRVTKGKGDIDILEHYDYCDALDDLLERRAGMEEGLRAAIATLRRAQADEMSASADLDWVEGRGDGNR